MIIGIQTLVLLVLIFFFLISRSGVMETTSRPWNLLKGNLTNPFWSEENWKIHRNLHSRSKISFALSLSINIQENPLWMVSDFSFLNYLTIIWPMIILTFCTYWLINFFYETFHKWTYGLYLSEMLKNFLPDEPSCLEIFARSLIPDWTSWGNETIKYQHSDYFEEKTIVKWIIVFFYLQICNFINFKHFVYYL